MQILVTIALVVIAVLLFELIIGLHEFGHFITAKLSGIKVNEFALGMGPKLFSFKKGETQYSLRLFPIGGYCAMEGEDEDSPEPRSFNNAKVIHFFFCIFNLCTILPFYCFILPFHFSIPYLTTFTASFLLHFSYPDAKMKAWTAKRHRLYTDASLYLQFELFQLFQQF